MTADEVRASQHAWAKHLDVPVRLVATGGAPFVLLPPGEFEMGVADAALPGSPAPEGDWRYRTSEVDRTLHAPVHRVVISKPLYFGETEITNAQFRAFVAATNYVTDAERNGGWGREDKGWVKRPGYSWKNLGQRVCIDDYPVMNVTWNDATAYCRWLSTAGRTATLSPAERSRMGIRRPRRGADELPLWRRSRAAQRLCVVWRQL